MLIDDADRRAVYLSGRLGHAILSLEDALHGDVPVLDRVHPGTRPRPRIHSTPTLGIDWPSVGRDGNPLEYVRSTKDAAAPRLADLRR